MERTEEYKPYSKAALSAFLSPTRPCGGGGREGAATAPSLLLPPPSILSEAVVKDNSTSTLFESATKNTREH